MSDDCLRPWRAWLCWGEVLKGCGLVCEVDSVDGVDLRSRRASSFCEVAVKGCGSLELLGSVDVFGLRNWRASASWDVGVVRVTPCISLRAAALLMVLLRNLWIMVRSFFFWW